MKTASKKLPTIAEVQAAKGIPAVVVNPAAVVAPATPETTKPKNRKEKVKKVAYPGLECDASGKPTKKLTEWPADFDKAAHDPLKKSDFENEGPWLIHRAEFLEGVAARLRKDAEAAATLGNKADRAKAKRLSRMEEQMAQMRAELEASGIDVDKLMGNMKPKADAPKAE